MRGSKISPCPPCSDPHPEAKQIPQMPGSWESVFREQALLAPFPLGGGRVPPGALSPYPPTHRQLQVEEKSAIEQAKQTNQPTKILSTG